MPEDLKTGFEWLTKIKEGMEAAKNDNQELIKRFEDIRAVHHTFTQFELSRVKMQEGEASPRAVELEDKLSRNLEVVHRLGVEGEVAAIRPPRTADKDALIHGRIVDEKSRGQSGMRVALTDRDGKRIDVGDSEVDASGYFSFVLDPEKIEAITKNNKEIFMTVSNKNGEVLYRRPSPFKPVAGGAIKENVVVSSRVVPVVEKKPEPVVRPTKPIVVRKRPVKKDK